MYRAKTDLARHGIGLVYDTCPHCSFQAINLNFPLLTHCPCPWSVYHISQSVTRQLQSISLKHLPLPHFTSLTSLPRPPTCLTKRSDVDPSLCHDPSIIDHQSANPPRCPTTLTDIGSLLSIQLNSQTTNPILKHTHVAPISSTTRNSASHPPPSSATG
jgi:hypothetical protein